MQYHGDRARRAERPRYAATPKPKSMSRPVSPTGRHDRVGSAGNASRPSVGHLSGPGGPIESLRRPRNA